MSQVPLSDPAADARLLAEARAAQATQGQPAASQPAASRPAGKPHPLAGIGLRIDLGDRSIDVEFGDIDGLEWREIRKATGLKPQDAMLAVGELDLEVVGALVWVWRRRTEPDIGFDEVVKGLSLAAIREVDGSDTVPEG